MEQREQNGGQRREILTWRHGEWERGGKLESER